MLEESNVLLAELKNANKLKQIKQAKLTYRLQLIKKWSIRIIISLFILSSLFYPIQTGKVIGKWINNYFGTIKTEMYGN